MSDAAAGFAGRRRSLFGLALRMTLLTLVTLGLYRFWAKTRLRRWYWSAVRVDGLPLEYSGTGAEKLLGFLVAVVVLAAWLGLVNLLLVFVSLSYFGGNVVGYIASAVLLVPLIFAARYRARRYVLARTRWAGLRFGVAPGAWGYAWRMTMHALATLVTAGLWWPRMTVAMEKYRIDRTRFGDAEMVQGGTPGMLYPAIIPLVLAVALTAIAVGLAVVLQTPVPLFGLIATVPLALYGLAHYHVTAIRRLADLKRAGPLTVTARPRALRILWIWCAGNLASALVAGLVFVIPVTVTLFMLGAIGGRVAPEGQTVTLVASLPVILGYFAAFVLFGVARHVFVTRPLWRHYAETTTVHGLDRLGELRQADRDLGTGAEGLAEALDVGAAI